MSMARCHLETIHTAAAVMWDMFFPFFTRSWYKYNITILWVCFYVHISVHLIADIVNQYRPEAWCKHFLYEISHFLISLVFCHWGSTATSGGSGVKISSLMSLVLCLRGYSWSVIDRDPWTVGEITTRNENISAIRALVDIWLRGN